MVVMIVVVDVIVLQGPDVKGGILGCLRDFS